MIAGACGLNANAAVALAVWARAALVAAAIRIRPPGVCETPDVRTVLFHKSDLSKACWSRAEAELLFDRYAMQALLPRKQPTEARDFLDYAVLCLQTIDEEMGSGKGKETMVEALADAFGGYLQAFVLPAAKRAYYEGTVDYDTCSRLYALHNDLKSVLKTDGGDWAGAVEAKGRRKPAPLRFRPAKNGCEQIIFGPGCKHQNAAEGGGRENATADVPADPALQIPIPFFDDCKRPNAVAVPLRNCSLVSLSLEASKTVLVTYYEMSIGCVEQRCKKDPKYDCARKKNEFNKRYYAFLNKYLAPRLLDTTWYPAFYRVIPLIDAVKRSAPADSGPCRNENDARDSESELKHMLRTDKSLLMFMLSPLFALFWIFLCLMLLAAAFTCYRFGGNSEPDCKPTRHSVSGEDVTDEDDGRCHRCICKSKAKVGFTARFYCRKNTLCDGESCPCLKTTDADGERKDDRDRDRTTSVSSSRRTSNAYADRGSTHSSR